VDIPKRIPYGFGGFSHMPNFLMEPMIFKAQRLLEQENSVTRRPGPDRSLFYAVSDTNPVVSHELSVRLTSGKFSCNCLGWSGLHVCAHAMTLAVQQHLLDKFAAWHAQDRKKNGTSFDAVVAHSVTKNIGKTTKRTQVPARLTDLRTWETRSAILRKYRMRTF